MNKYETINYVMRTPYNVNPNVLIQNISESGSGGGVSSWNDLTDKPFGYTEEIMFEGTEKDEIKPFELILGDEYVVVLNNETYNCIATKDGGAPVVYIGDVNIAMGNFDAAEIPFICFNGTLLTAFETYTISISKKSVQKIDTNFLPLDIETVEETKRVTLVDGEGTFSLYSPNGTVYPTTPSEVVLQGGESIHVTIHTTVGTLDTTCVVGRTLNNSSSGEYYLIEIENGELKEGTAITSLRYYLYNNSFSVHGYGEIAQTQFSLLVTYDNKTVRQIINDKHLSDKITENSLKLDIYFKNSGVQKNYTFNEVHKALEERRNVYVTVNLADVNKDTFYIGQIASYTPSFIYIAFLNTDFKVTLQGDDSVGWENMPSIE